jgi:uncharacterized protein (DUF58 family)
VSDASLTSPAFQARLEKLDLVAQKILSGEIRGDLPTGRSGSGALFRGHARYSPGDDLRFLDWNVWSRLGELLIKQFDAEENLDLRLLVDTSGSMGFGLNDKLSCVREVAALLGMVALNHHGVVHLAPFPHESAPRRFKGRTRLWPLLRELEGLHAKGTAFLDDKIPQLEAHRSRGLAIVLSDFFVEGGYDEGLTRLQRAGFRVAVVHVLDQRDLRPEVDGPVKLIDVETAATVRANPDEGLLDAYEVEATRWCRSVEQFCLSKRIAYVRVDTAWPLERILRELLLDGGLLH